MVKHLLKVLVLGVFFAGAGMVTAGEEEGAQPPVKTRKVPALREATYKAIAEAQALIENEEEPNPQAAVEVLLKLKDRRGINGYEKGQIWNMLAFAYYSMEDVDNTIMAYEQVLAQGEDITLALEQSSLRALFQLFYQQENYLKSIEYIERWEAVAQQPDPVVLYLKATALYQLERWQESLQSSIECVELARALDREVKENWIYLQVVLYNELEDYDNVIRVLEEMVISWPKKQYWMHLASMYAEKDLEDKALSAFYAVYYQGLFERESEFVMLAQRLLNAEVPYEASVILRKGLDSGVIEKDEKNMRLLGQALTMAQETEQAIEAWKEATEHAEDGRIFYRLAQALANSDRHEEAVTAYRDALERGDLRDSREVDFWLGISLMQLERWDDAKRYFNSAAQDKDRRERAREYINYINGEVRRQQVLADMAGA